MTVYRAPATRPYQRRFRVFSLSAIAVLLGIALFSIYEPQNVGRTTNIVLALIMGGIALAMFIYGISLSPKEALWQLKHSYQWELTKDEVIQSRNDGTIVVIPLNGIKSLRESQGWLLVIASESLGGIMIPRDIDGYAEIRQQLIAYCPLTSAPKFNPLATILPLFVLATLFGLVIVSHVPAVVIGSGIVLVLLWPLFAGYALRPFWRANSVRTRLVISYLLSWLILVWIVYKAVKAVV